MKRMVGTVTLGLALLLPAVAVSQQKSDHVAAAPSSPAQICAAGDSQLPAVNTEHAWRLRAYEDLDCALAILDHALATQGNVITVSRHEAERARARLWSARDAAARIGR
ncbi:MAG TPA: hypothetical protein VFO21_03200 [Vicinamibacterales bacterium]|nr:hypothetical protein [Vicinamibacterales bacterium]